MTSYPSQQFAPPPPAAPPQKKSNSVLITCGIIAAVLFCLGAIGVGVFFLMNGSGGEAADLAVAVNAPPPLYQDQEYKISVRLSNTGEDTLEVSELRLPKSILESSTLRSVSPAATGTADYDDQIGYKFDLSLGAGESESVTFTLQSSAAGDFSGEVIALTGRKTASASVRVLVNQGQAAAQNVTEPTLAPAATLAPADLGDIPYQAVVQIVAIVEYDGEVGTGWTGSGSIISPDGLILTNAHVVMSDRYYTVQHLLVAMTVAPDSPPEVQYEMELFQVDEAMDIAVGKITKDADGNPIDTASLNLPTVPLGSSDSLSLGDNITIIGYPGIGGDTITLTRGEVSGFTAEDPYGNRAFIKTSATIAGGNSGGLAANADGELIGVPTQLGYGGDDQYVDCRVLTDTNRDGYVDENDNCVPTGGFINALRPLTLAQPYIDAARRGEVNIQTGVASAPQEEMPAEENVLFSDDFSTTDNWPIDVLSTGAVGYSSDGYYYIQVDDPNQVIWSVPDGNYEDTIVQVDLSVIQGSGESEYGIICRMVDGDNYYTLEISEDGYFSIWKRQYGEWTALYDWTATGDAYFSDQSATLYAGCIGNELTVAVNDTVLASVTDTSFSSGQVGLFVGTFDRGGATVGFDNFFVYGP